MILQIAVFPILFIIAMGGCVYVAYLRIRLQFFARGGRQIKRNFNVVILLSSVLSLFIGCFCAAPSFLLWRSHAIQVFMLAITDFRGYASHFTPIGRNFLYDMGITGFIAAFSCIIVFWFALFSLIHSSFSAALSSSRLERGASRR